MEKYLRKSIRIGTAKKGEHLTSLGVGQLPIWITLGDGRKTKLRYHGHAGNCSSARRASLRRSIPTIRRIHLCGSCMLGRTGMRTSERVGGPVPQTLPSSSATLSSHRRSRRPWPEFFLVMSSLHYRWVISVARLHIGRAQLARPRRPLHDNVAASLQPCVALVTTDVQASSEVRFLQGSTELLGCCLAMGRKEASR